MKNKALIFSLAGAFVCLLALTLAINHGRLPEPSKPGLISSAAASSPEADLSTAQPAETALPTVNALGQPYRKHHSKKRENYPHLSDEEFANFRCIATTGMGKNVLYRSSSPVDPSLGRNAYADEATRKAGIKTALNLANKRSVMKAYEGYADTYYSGLDICPLNMSQNRKSSSTRRKLAKGLRYIISHDGPYLVHCTYGRDRTGFVCAILECLMGASAEEILDDYMLTYYSFYGMTPEMEIFDTTREALCKDLATVFKIDSITGDGVDLAKCANKYLRRIGLEKAEIAALKEKLGTDLA